ncbi:glycosyltransferase [Pararoseomonas indoligenes]|uniref:Glycosyltransferase n=1 Tax=Roseomonas indoligenes TaxID=2820811 RepID=A0A940N382_9PROT|nr:glycosyltransferase [Pararoseomonas indoligenes]MBP0495945.1 glycosyltransferase [Pararoseomonas indoligenes]
MGVDDFKKSKPLSLEAEVSVIKKSKQMHPKWYLAEYPDVQLAGMDPFEHYLLYGARMGRRPRNGFDTNFYLDRYPDVRDSGLNPLIHYILHGKNEGRLQCLEDLQQRRERARQRVSQIALKMYPCGFVDLPIDELTKLSQSIQPVERFLAAKTLLLWHYRRRSPSDFEQAYRLSEVCLSTAQDDVEFTQALTLQSLCLHGLNHKSDGIALRPERRATANNTDFLLAQANFATDNGERLALINTALEETGIPPVRLDESLSTELYDQLTGTSTASGNDESEPLISVIIAAYNAERTIPTTLRSLLLQSWRKLEILVIDDCSTDQTRAVVRRIAKSDDRVRLIKMEKNGGAYVARNRGLDEASGAIATIHDADDWSHPIKLRTQAEFLLANEAMLACTSKQARATVDLIFERPNQNGDLTTLNTSSLMFRAAAVRDKLGYWDTVRFGADTEMLKRIQTLAPKTGLGMMKTGPLSFQRISSSSIVANEFFGIEGAHFGARYAYLDSYTSVHEDPQKLRYGKDHSKRSFPAPYPMLPQRKLPLKPRHFDVIIASDFRMTGGSTRSSIEELLCQNKFGLNTAIMQMFRYDIDPRRNFLNVFREKMDVSELNCLVYGEEASCDLLIVRYPPVLQHFQRFLPKVNASKVNVIVNQTPLSDYSGEGDVRFTMREAAENCRRFFGKDAEWYPIGPLVRDALNDHHSHELDHIKLSPDDWYNIIDFGGWFRGPRTRSAKDRLRIGRHSRDNMVKWPNTRELVLLTYPESDDVEVHVLGGASTPASLIGHVPQNWTVYDFGARSPRAFLAEVDVFVYFTHPDWIESFGRSIIEAMAVGVPVILPPVYRPLFQDAAIYAEPEEVVGLAKALHANDEAYAAQVNRALNYVSSNFSYELHMSRLADAGVHNAQDWAVRKS